MLDDNRKICRMHRNDGTTHKTAAHDASGASLAVPDAAEGARPSKMPEMTESLRGAALIAEVARQLPERPGVYRYFDAQGELLYVGKARNLKRRVSSYARGRGHATRIMMMINQVARIEFTTTATEAEALLLEANLIKRLKPRFNILLRDDKSFPYILIARNHAAPRLMKHRGARRIPGNYYGPFANAGAVNRAIAAMQKAFLLRTCTDSVYANRSRPCLLHQIRRCAAPCTGEVSEEEYATLVQQAEAFLSGRSKQVQAELTRQMQQAAERLDYEQAAVLRDRLAAMRHITQGQGVNPRSFEAADVFAIVQDGGTSCIQAFFFRNWQNWGNRAYFPRAEAERPAADVLAAFVAQFYDAHPVPPLVLLSHSLPEQALLEQALSEKAGHKVRIITPQRGEKRQFVQQALDNAQETLAQRLASSRAQRQLLQGVAAFFGLPQPPRRIEVFDNSHLSGSNPVSAMIVAGPEGFMKAHYRTFNLRDAAAARGDDYAMMREVMRRRLSRLADASGADHARKQPDDTEEGFPQLPDLILIDGGAGQVKAALSVAEEQGLAQRITFVGIAKGPQRNAGEETFHMADGSTRTLCKRDPVLYYLQRLRDEAHRFAIGAQRQRRRKEARRSTLDAIPGIGPARKRALLAAFGSVRAIARAEVVELAAVEGISRQLAQQIHDHFH